jgi:hypothetical protein
VKDDPTGTSVLVAAHGRGAPLLQRNVVSPGAGTAGGPRLGAPCALHVNDTLDVQDVPLPPELSRDPCSIRSLVQIPIGSPSAPRGALLLGNLLPNGFEGKEWQVRLHVAAAGLLPHVRHAQVEQMAHLLKAMDDTHDPVALISVLLRVRLFGDRARRAAPRRRRQARPVADVPSPPPQPASSPPPPACPLPPTQSASRYMRKACGLRATCRLALLDPSDPARALLFEALRAAGPEPAGGAAHALTLPGDAEAEVVASDMGLANTLLSSALQGQAARFIMEAGVYMQVGAAFGGRRVVAALRRAALDVASRPAGGTGIPRR